MTGRALPDAGLFDFYLYAILGLSINPTFYTILRSIIVNQIIVGTITFFRSPVKAEKCIFMAIPHWKKTVMHHL